MGDLDHDRMSHHLQLAKFYYMLLIASAFSLMRKCWSSPQRCTYTVCVPFVV